MQKKYRRNYECPTEFAMDVLGGKWTTVILAFLKERPLRYSEFRTLMPKLSDKVLAGRLHELIDAGLVVLLKPATAARTDRYALSERGESLRPVVTGLYRWGSRHAKSFGVHVGAPMKRLGSEPTAQPAARPSGSPNKTGCSVAGAGS